MIRPLPRTPPQRETHRPPAAAVTLDWLHLAILLGAVQGVFLALVLATQRRNRTANRILAVAIVAFSVHLASSVYYAAGLEGTYPHFFGVAYPLPLLYGPLIYLYAVTASDRARTLHGRDALHFAPFVIVVLAAFPIYMMSGAEKIAFYRGLQQGIVPLLLKIVDPLKLLSGVVYATATILFLRKHRARVKESYSTIERVNLQWLVQLAVAAAVIWALAVGFRILDPIDHQLAERGDDVVALAIAILVYWIGYKALRQPEVFDFAALDRPFAVEEVGARPSGGAVRTPVAQARRPAEELGHARAMFDQAAVAAGEERTPIQPTVAEVGQSAAASHTAADVAPSIPQVPKTAPNFEPAPPALVLESSRSTAKSSPPALTARYERSGLSDREAAALERALLHVMETERPWQNSELTLADLAERLKTSPHKLSEVLNSQVGQTFYDFVNAYRVRDVQRRIADERSQHLKILALAMDAGFASKSTFNHVFRKHTGHTPSAYRRSLAS